MTYDCGDPRNGFAKSVGPQSSVHGLWEDRGGGNTPEEFLRIIRHPRENQVFLSQILH